ncbi:MAG: ATP-binding protein [Candidatus Thorarchaeota archaeon]
MSPDVESRYLTLFEDSPVSLWEEDFSDVKKYIDSLKAQGIDDLRKYFEDDPDEIWKCANLVKVIRVNKATLDLQGVKTEEELLGSLGKILVKDALYLFLGEILTIADGGHKFECTVTLSTVKGEPRHILMGLSVPEEFRNTYEMVIISMLDITETVQAKKALEEALETAAFYNDLMAHDLSNMMQGIMSSMELMLEGGLLNEEIHHLVHAALSQSKRGAALVSYVKKLAALEGETLDLIFLDPYSSLVVAEEMIKNTFPEKEIHITKDFSENMYQVHADEFLVDVFYNLLHNSVRLDPSNFVQIDVHVKDDSKHFLTLIIKDSGPGIDDRRKQSILSGQHDASKRVTGIGLTLVKRIIDRYGGDLWIEDSVKGDHTKGVCFIFSIPLKKL